MAFAVQFLNAYLRMLSLAWRVMTSCVRAVESTLCEVYLTGSRFCSGYFSTARNLLNALLYDLNIRDVGLYTASKLIDSLTYLPATLTRFSARLTDMPVLIKLITLLQTPLPLSRAAKGVLCCWRWWPVNYLRLCTYCIVTIASGLRCALECIKAVAFSLCINFGPLFGMSPAEWLGWLWQMANTACCSWQGAGAHRQQTSQLALAPLFLETFDDTV